MIELTDREHMHLRDLQRAGAAGQLIGEIPTSTAIRLELAGFAAISASRPQRATITRNGTAHLRRSVFA